MSFEGIDSLRNELESTIQEIPDSCGWSMSRTPPVKYHNSPYLVTAPTNGDPINLREGMRAFDNFFLVVKRETIGLVLSAWERDSIRIDIHSSLGFAIRTASHKARDFIPHIAIAYLKPFANEVDTIINILKEVIPNFNFISQEPTDRVCELSLFILQSYVEPHIRSEKGECVASNIHIDQMFTFVVGCYLLLKPIVERNVKELREEIEVDEQ